MMQDSFLGRLNRIYARLVHFYLTCDQAEFQHRSHILLRGSFAKIGPDTISHKSSCTAAKFWPRKSRNLIGPLTIELSTEVN